MLQIFKSHIFREKTDYKIVKLCQKSETNPSWSVLLLKIGPHFGKHTNKGTMPRVSTHA